MTVSCWSNFPLWFFKTTRTDGIEWEVGPRIKKAVRSPLEYVDGSRKAPGSTEELIFSSYNGWPVGSIGKHPMVYSAQMLWSLTLEKPLLKLTSQFMNLTRSRWDSVRKALLALFFFF